MIYNMIAGDMIRFGIISSIFLVSFSQGLQICETITFFTDVLLPFLSVLLCRKGYDG
jgi:hypothetical protein